jgi:heme/copper-type cytochrome/quinol oxidase subunit 4
MNGLESVQALPTVALVAIGVMVVVQLVLDVIALLDLYRRPAEQVTTGKKWVWILIILGVNTIGAILYLVVGRKPPMVTEVPLSAPGATRASDAADLLYGKDIDPR